MPNFKPTPAGFFPSVSLPREGIFDTLPSTPTLRNLVLHKTRLFFTLKSGTSGLRQHGPGQFNREEQGLCSKTTVRSSLKSLGKFLNPFEPRGEMYCVRITWSYARTFLAQYDIIKLSPQSHFLSKGASCLLCRVEDTVGPLGAGFGQGQRAAIPPAQGPREGRALSVNTRNNNPFLTLGATPTEREEAHGGSS